MDERKRRYRIYHLDRSDVAEVGEVCEQIVVAENYHYARLIASTAAGGEGAGAWRIMGEGRRVADISEIGLAKEGQRRSVIMTRAEGE